ncbi:hypothetical protein KEJ33_06230, partial [Candidatus Bathyarchaeota archaeon]|nr:hypothetical protein [Candidatus Bathyarchaeota archaeon]
SAAETTIRVLDCFTKEPVVNQEIEFVPVTVISGNTGNTFEYHYEKRELFLTNNSGEVYFKIPDDKAFKFNILVYHKTLSDEGELKTTIERISPEGIIKANESKKYYTTCIPREFQIKLKIKTNFNFLFSWIRIFKAGALGTPGAVSCRLSRGIDGLRGYSKEIPLGIFYEDYELRNSDFMPADVQTFYEKGTEGKCFVYGLDLIRGVGGIKEIDLRSLSPNEINEVELNLDKDEDSMKNSLREIFRAITINNPSEETIEILIGKIYGLFP